MLEYLLLGLLALIIVLLVVVLVRDRRPTTDPYLKAAVDSLSRENGETRKELLGMLEQYRSATTLSMDHIRMDNNAKLELYRTSVMQEVSTLGGSVAESLKTMRQENDQQLDAIRQSVDSRLKTSLTESFSVVNEQLNEVHKGLGEMKELASGVGDLRRLMGNIKSRGIMGEVQAKNILDDILLPNQYETNCICREGTADRVEFAVRLPGKENHDVLLPIDCKFPREDYERFLDAQEQADKEGVQKALDALRRRIDEEASTIQQKYIAPPRTTDFALLFLPFEGLYAEVLRIPGLYDDMLRKHKVVLSGPTTLAAILNSFQFGFRTIAIERRSEEVWTLLSVVKTEFGTFASDLERVRSRLDQASSSLDSVDKRTRIMGKKLKDVESLDAEKAEQVLEENTVDTE